MPAAGFLAALESAGAVLGLFNSIQELIDKISEKFSQFIEKVKKSIQMIYESLKSIAEMTLMPAMQQQSLKDLIIVNSGGNNKGNKIFDSFKAEALRTGQDVQEYLKGGISLFSITDEQDKLEKLIDYANRLSILSPDHKSMSESVDSLIKAYSGDSSGLASNFGISQGVIDQSGIKEKASQGDLGGFITSLEQIMNQSGKTKAALDHMVDTPLNEWNTLVNNFKNSLSQMGEGAMGTLLPLLKKLNDAFASGKFDPFIKQVGSVLSVLAGVVRILVEGFLKLINFVQENWSIIKPILIAIATVFLVTIISQLIMIGALLFLLNLPLILVIGLIAVVIMYLSMIGITGEDVLGYLIGSFLVFFGTILNFFIMLYNHFATLYEFLANLFIDPQYAFDQFVYSTKVGFLGLMYRLTRAAEDFAIGFASAINQAIKPVADYYNSMLPLINQFHNSGLQEIHISTDEEIKANGHTFSNEIKKQMDSIPEPTSDKNVVSLPRKDYYDTTKLMAMGPEIAGWLSGAFNFMGNSFLGDGREYPPKKGDKGNAATNDYLNHYLPNMPSDINNVKNVDKIRGIQDPVDISSEDIKLLRDLAELQAIQHFVSLTPTVQVTTGDINNGADLDTIVSRIGQKLEEEFVSTAQGVYM